jgi:beta-N-acetylhexosaminidase
MKFLIPILFYFFLFSGETFGGNDGWIDGKLKSLSLEEKIGQMLMLGVSGSVLDNELASTLDRVYLGNIILFESNIQSKEQLSVFIKHLQNRTLMRTGIPLIVAIDQEGGLVNRIGKKIDPIRTQYSPRTLGRAYVFKEKETKKVLRKFYRNLASKMKDWGINMNLAPVLDISQDPTSPIFSRSFSGEPKTVSAMGLDMSLAMQSFGIMVTGKHFPNLGSTRIDSHRDLPIVHRTIKELSQHELIPYFKLKNDIDVIMLGHILIPDLDPILPASISPKATHFIRKKIGFDGVIMTDDLKMGALTKNFSMAQLINNILKSDVDMILFASRNIAYEEIFMMMLSAVKKKEITMERIDRSVKRILQLKRRYLYSNNEISIATNLDDWLN